MGMQRIVWTVLPRALEGRRLTVSLVPSIRLTPTNAAEQTLAGWPDFADWPELLKHAAFELDVRGPVPLGPFKLRLLAKPLRSEVWSKVFPATVPVAGFQFTDLSQHNLRSFPARTVVGFLHTHYAALAQHDGLHRPSLFGPPNRLRTMLGQIGIRNFREKGGLDRWFTTVEERWVGNGKKAVERPSPIEGALTADYFSEEGVAPEFVVGIDGKPHPNQSSSVSQRRLRRALPSTAAQLKSNYFSGEPEYALYQANRFYDRPENAATPQRLPQPGTGAQGVTAPPFDFHRLASSFGDAPQVMHALGLVIEAEIDDHGGLLDAALHKASHQVLNGQMRIMSLVVRGLDQSTENVRPWTAFRLTPTRFTADARTPRHRGGLLRLAGARAIGALETEAIGQGLGFALTSVDPDGAALKTVGLALTAQDHLRKVANPNDADTLREPGRLTYTTAAGQTVPALRSGGLTLVESGRASNVADDTIAASLKNDALNAKQGDNIVFYAEDVLRGYRIDIVPESIGKPFSLCARMPAYRWKTGGLVLAEVKGDEGYVSGASTSTKPPEELPPNATQDHYLHEALVKWTGWSLVVPRPGRRIRAYPDSTTPAADRDKVGLVQEEIVDEQTDADLHGKGSPVLRDATVAPNSLPRLRFSQAYRFRVRLVDLAGHGLALTDPDKLEEASDPIPYLRYEPVDPPPLALRARLSEGEALERMVIRSDVRTSAADYLNRAPYDSNDPARTGFVYLDESERHVVPPKTSQSMAEQHGAFEDAFGASPQAIADVYKQIASREAGTLYDGGASVRVITPPDPATNTASSERDLAQRPPEGFRLLPGEYVIHTEANLPTPYLPDPVAGAAAFRGLPGVVQPGVIDAQDGVVVVRIPQTEEHVLIVPFAGKWPDVQGFRIRAVEHPDELALDPCVPKTVLPVRVPKWDSADRVLTVYLRKGEVAPVRYAATLRPNFIHHMAIPRLVPSPLMVAIQSILGAHWMVTPDRPLTLVHATQTPICAPRFEQLHLTRTEGATWVDMLRTRVQLHARTTGKVEVMAEWMEWIDDPSLPMPIRRKFSAQLPEAVVPAVPVGAEEPFTGVDLAQLGTGKGAAREAHMRHDFGDHRFRLVRYRLRGTTRFREYLPPLFADNPSSLCVDGPDFAGNTLVLPPAYAQEYRLVDSNPEPQRPSDAELGAPLLATAAQPLPGLIVPNSRRPDAPKVAYVVPTFRWSESTKDGVVHCVRKGNGLRVYLERPWYSSGEGELLGVIAGSHDAKERQLDGLNPKWIPHVSQWGQDPILASERPRSVMSAAQFAARVHEDDYFLPEANDTVLVVGHRVHYDFERRLWYADLEIDAGASYNPFVRLALVRLQPHSLPACALSEVVHTQFAQLLPMREIRLDVHERRAALRVFGPAPEIGAASGRGELSGRYDLPADQADQWSGLAGYTRGRNRIEVVVQEQDGALDTDLDWVDIGGAILSGDAVPGQLTPRGDVRSPVEASPRASLKLTDRSTIWRPIPEAVLEQNLGLLHLLRNDLLLEGMAELPLPREGSRRRLMVREYERHFADFDVTDHAALLRVSRPAMTERLIFAREFYVLGYLPEAQEHR
ncbi:MAG: hypothetical protein WBA53_16970 [Burkholderiaceae bacterium]